MGRDSTRESKDPFLAVTSTWAMDLGALRHKAARAVELELAKAYTAAYHAYLHAAEGFLEVARASRGADELRSMAARLMDRAERLVPHLGTPGTSTWEVSATDEWPLWSAVASDNVSVLPSPALSPHQLALCAHSRCSTAPVYVGGVGVKTGGLQQGAATDCSIVVALEMAAQHDACWGTQVRRVTSPLTQLAHGALQRRTDGIPTASDRYAVRIYVDGAARRITIDGSLPHSPDGTLLGARPRGTAQQWPALLEKALLVARKSSYAYRGSDPAADMFMLTGWLPEYVPLHDVAFQREKTWKRVYDGWRAGHCLVALGTGAALHSPDAIPGLVAQHCYGIAHMDEHTDERIVALVNPWKETGEPPGHDKSTSLAAWNMHPTIPADPGAPLVCRWEDVCASFDTLFLNWDPALLPHKCSVHAAWDKSDVTVCLDGGLTAHCDQYVVHTAAESSSQDDKVWLHLERHAAGGDAYIALHAFPTLKHTRRAHAESGGLRGVYVDAPHTLLRLHTSDAAQYTVAVARHGANTPASYTLSAHASCPVTLEPLPHSQPHRVVVHGAWRARSAGGPPTEPTFRHNPQFRVEVHEGALLPSLQVMVATSSSVAVHAALVRSGERVSDIQHALVSSGAYTFGVALCDAEAIQPGLYTLIVSAYEAGRHAEFSVAVESSAPVSVKPIQPEGAGLYHRACTPTQDYVPMRVCTSMPVRVCASRRWRRDPLHLSLWAGATCVAERTEDSATGVSLECSVPPGEYTLHVSSPACIDVYSPQPVELE